MYLFFDTETTGLPKNYNAPHTDTANWPRLVQLAWVLCDANGETMEKADAIVKPDGWVIGEQAAAIHGITQERAMAEGKQLPIVLTRMAQILQWEEPVALVAHNIAFDAKIVAAEFTRLGWPNYLKGHKGICTMQRSTEYCRLPSAHGHKGYKWPKLQELYMKLFIDSFSEAHNAAADIKATVRCFFELLRLKVIEP